jgi:hypothetical protein
MRQTTTGVLHGGRWNLPASIQGVRRQCLLRDSNKGETEVQRSETIWHLAHFITTIVEGKPLPAEIIDQEIKEQLRNQPAAEGAPTTGGE